MLLLSLLAAVLLHVKMHCAVACRALVVIALWLSLSLVLQILIFKVLNMLMGVHWTSPVALHGGRDYEMVTQFMRIVASLFVRCRLPLVSR